MNFNLFFNRTKNLILNPAMEWVRIEAETTSKKEIVKSYVIPFAILITICSFIGDSFFSIDSYSVTIILTKVIISGVLMIGGVYLSALIINELKTSFAMPKNSVATFKLVAYSFNSFYIASCLVGLLPDYGILLILAVHSVYLFWIGTGTVVRIPEDNKVGFVIVSLLIIIGIFAILSLLVGTIVSGMLYISNPL